MRSFSRLKIGTISFLFLALILSLPILSTNKITTHASGTNNKFSPEGSMISSTLKSKCGKWNVTSSPNLGTSENILNAVTAISTKDAWAVGYYNNNTVPGPLQTLIEHWNGTNWSIVTSPNVGTSHNVLNGVASVSTNNVWAVGYSLNNGQQTLIEHWDGTSWSVIPSPNVGTNTNVLNAVTNVPGSNQLWAVGYYNDTDTTYQPLIEYWNGTSWNVFSNPSLATIDNFLNGVTALSPNNVWAVGTDNNTAAGVEQTLTEHWNGTSWNVVSSPNQGNNGYLHTAVRVAGSSKLWAVGQYNNTNTSYETLTEYWNGKSWNIVASPNPTPEGATTVVSFQGVASISVNNVWAVGLYQYGNGMTPPQSLAEHWDGTSWSIVSTPSPEVGSTFNGVAEVLHSGQLWAVGYSYTPGSINHTLIEFYC